MLSFVYDGGEFWRLAVESLASSNLGFERYVFSFDARTFQKDVEWIIEGRDELKGNVTVFKSECEPGLGAHIRNFTRNHQPSDFPETTHFLLFFSDDYLDRSVDPDALRSELNLKDSTFYGSWRFELDGQISFEQGWSGEILDFRNWSVFPKGRTNASGMIVPISAIWNYASTVQSSYWAAGLELWLTHLSGSKWVRALERPLVINRASKSQLGSQIPLNETLRASSEFLRSLINSGELSVKSTLIARARIFRSKLGINFENSGFNRRWLGNKG